MTSTIIQRLIRFVVILVVQLAVLNHIHLFGYATPLVMAYLTMVFHRGASRIGLLLWGFAVGMVYDVFSNTIGMGMASCTLLAMVQPSLQNLFMPRDAAADMRPSFRTMGPARYIGYVFLTMLLFHTVFYALDALTLHNWMLTLVGIGGGTLISVVLIVIADLFIHPRTQVE